MKNRRDLTQGPILKSLILVALPIMTTAFMQMTYNLADMIWIGRIGYDAVSAVGTAGFYMWFSVGLVRLSQAGAEIGVAQSLGAGDELKARDYGRNALQFAVLSALIFSSVLLIFTRPLIAFFNIPNAQVNQWAQSYLSIVALGMPFSFANLVFSSIYNGSGNSRVPFYFNFFGVLINVILDPILIFGLLGLPALGVKGAAFATLIGQIVVLILFLFHVTSAKSPFSAFRFFVRPMLEKIKVIIKYGFPVALQSIAFTFFAMLIARKLSDFGDMPIAVQKVGSQIESIAWMIATGFSVALSAFVGQNFGAKQQERIRRGYWLAMRIMLIWGGIVTFLLIVFAEPIFSIFIPDSRVIPYGAVYLRILGISQIFMCIEIATGGAFNGLGKTIPPAVIGIFFTGLRVPFAYLLSQPEILGLNGIWWSVSMSSIFKGIFAFFVFLWVFKKGKFVLVT